MSGPIAPASPPTSTAINLSGTAASAPVNVPGAGACHPASGTCPEPATISCPASEIVPRASDAPVPPCTSSSLSGATTVDSGDRALAGTDDICVGAGSPVGAATAALDSAAGSLDVSDDCGCATGAPDASGLEG